MPEAFQPYSVIPVTDKCVLPKASDARDEVLELPKWKWAAGRKNRDITVLTTCLHTLPLVV